MSRASHRRDSSGQSRGESSPRAAGLRQSSSATAATAPGLPALGPYQRSGPRLRIASASPPSSTTSRTTSSASTCTAARSKSGSLAPSDPPQPLPPTSPLTSSPAAIVPGSAALTSNPAGQGAERAADQGRDVPPHDAIPPLANAPVSVSPWTKNPPRQITDAQCVDASTTNSCRPPSPWPSRHTAKIAISPPNSCSNSSLSSLSPVQPAGPLEQTQASSPHSQASLDRPDGAPLAPSPASTPPSHKKNSVDHLPLQQRQARPSVASKRTSISGSPRELLLLQRLKRSSISDESRAHYASRALSHPKLPANGHDGTSVSVSTPIPLVRVPRIRSFRSSISRKSCSSESTITMAPRVYDSGDDGSDDGADDDTLRAIDARFGGSGLHTTAPKCSMTEDTGDVFLRIASEEPARRRLDDRMQTSFARADRTPHRRPLSTAITSFQASSPPRLSRRLSDQQDSPPRTRADEDRATEIARAATYSILTRERPVSTYAGEDALRTRAGSSSTLRPSSLASRSLGSQDSSPERSTYARRRASITDSNQSLSGRSPTFNKSSAPGSSHGRAYHSSPLVRSVDLSSSGRTADLGHTAEETESTASTTAPSTVWDELDDIKSRIRRLELTGALPHGSGLTASRLSDERPATATTTVTTASLSPKRQTRPSTEYANSGTASQKEVHVILRSALSKSKHFMNANVYRALELAANDAIGMSTMLGMPGQLGPISSGSSTFGAANNVTDRQLRRRADGVCRGLTELCVALGEDAASSGPPTSSHSAKSVPLSQLDGPVTPSIPKSYASGLPVSRRASIAVEQGSTPPSNSSRTMSRFEERRKSLLNGSSLPMPRTSALSHSSPNGFTLSRQPSLMVSRTRRATTEETEDGRTSFLARTRRAETEDPEEGRRTSLLVRNRRGTVGEEGESAGLRVPSRANTDVYTAHGYGAEVSFDTLDTPPVSAELPASFSNLSRRRFGNSSFHSSRLAAPPHSSPISPRRYLERSIPDRDATIRAVEDGASRRPPLSQAISHIRTNSLSTKKQNQENVMSAPSSAAIATSVYR